MLKKIFTTLLSTNEDNTPQRVWDTRLPSIFQVLTEAKKAGLPLENIYLPDELEGSAYQLSLAYGTIDGITRYHGSKNESDADVAKLIDLLENVLLQNDDTDVALQPFYKALLEIDSLLTIIDPFVLHLSKNTNIAWEDLYSLVYRLATTSPDRNVVKFSLFVLGLYKNSDLISLFKLFAAHNEFTFYAIFGMKKLLLASEAERSMREIASQVNGWGKIFLVDFLAEKPSYLTREWMIEEGYKNDVLLQYSALTCARSGNLIEILNQPKLNEKRIVGVAYILHGLLIEDKPMKGIYYYQDGAEACLIYLRYLSQCRSISHLAVYQLLTALLEFIDDPKTDWERLALLEWDYDVIVYVKWLLNKIAERTNWKDLFETKLANYNDPEHELALAIHEKAGHDIWPLRFIAQKNSNKYLWFSLMQTNDHERFARVIELAKEKLDFLSFATGPEFRLFTQKDYKMATLLLFFLKKSAEFPQVRSELIAAVGLNAPMRRVRELTLSELEKWEDEYITEDLVLMLQELKRLENRREIKLRADMLIRQVGKKQIKQA